MLKDRTRNRFSQKQDLTAKGTQAVGHLLRRKSQLLILNSRFLVRVEKGRQGGQ